MRSEPRSPTHRGPESPDLGPPAPGPAERGRPATTRWAAVAAAFVATIAAATPGFAAGALADPIGSELGVGSGPFGLALCCFFGFTAIGSYGAARLVAWLGPSGQLALSGVFAGATLLALGRVDSMATLTTVLALAGLANSLVQPAAGRLLGSRVAPRRLALASGVVQAALGAAPLAAGLLVSLLAEPYGWRRACTIGGLLVVASAAMALLARGGPAGAAGRSDAAGRGSVDRAARRVLTLWILAAAFGTIGVNVTASFFVPIATDAGFPTATAGLLSTPAGALAAATRIAVGFTADRRPRANTAVTATMMAIGTVGLGLLAIGSPGTFVTGALLVVSGLWGWNGLLVASAVRLLPEHPATALAGLQAGFFTGATIAPLVFGTLGSAWGTGRAVLAAAGAALIAVGALLAGERLRRRHARSRGVQE